MSQSAGEDVFETVQETLTAPEWKQYEQQIAKLQAQASPDAKVEHNVKIDGVLSKTKRQIDTLVSRETSIFDGSTIAQLIVVECKKVGKTIGISYVDEFVGKLLDVGVPHGVLCSPSCFSAPAHSRAEGAHLPKVKLVTLDADDPSEVDYEDFLRPDCPSIGCEYGQISWREASAATGETIQAGTCYLCSTFAVGCPQCGEIVEADGNEQCGCEATYSAELSYESKGTEYESVWRLLGDEELEFNL